MEAFYTLQGEGYHQGKAAYFIRLGGCDVGCVWCDVKDSWDANAHPLKTIEEIVDEAKKFPGKLAVVTGGEPLMHDLEELSTALHSAGFQTNIETLIPSFPSNIQKQHRYILRFFFHNNLMGEE